MALTPDPRHDWSTCEALPECSTPGPSVLMSRRQMLVATAIGAAAWAGSRSALAQIAIDPKRRERDVLVVVFLRGGADGLNIVVPYGEDAYYRARPSLAIPRPGRGGVLDLDGFFGFNPALEPLLPFYREGRLALLHAVGSADQTRSHFEAMSAMERGLAGDERGVASGWLARYLLATESAQDSPLRAVALGTIMPDSLRGSPRTVAIESLDDFRLVVPEGLASQHEAMSDLAELYATAKDDMAHAGRETLSVLRRLGLLGAQPPKNDEYPSSDLGQGLRQVATLIRADLGLEVATLDRGGWDSHVAQGSTAGWLTSLLDDVGRSLAAFASDLGSEMNRVTVVVMTEFGRRLRENTGLGTDHGRASCMMILGGGVDGGTVIADWPGLESDRLEPPGDLRVTTDYRQVLADALRRRMGLEDAVGVFPGLSAGSNSIFS